MGARGPVPKRSTQRRRANKPKTPVTKAPAARRRVAVPRPDPDWHPAAKRFYAALRESGQAVFYEPSDWALAWLMTESLSRDLKPQFVALNELTGEPVVAVVPMKGASLAAYLKTASSLLLTEGDRRRVGLELERGAPDGETMDVPDLDAYRRSRRSG